MSWTANYPPGRDRWDLVATYARERSQMTHALVDELQRAGARPERIAGTWMVRASEWAAFQARHPVQHQEAPTTARAEPQPVAVPEAMADALHRQASAIEALREQLSELTSRLAAAETNP